MDDGVKTNKKTYSVVTTTVHIPRLLEAYIKDALQYGRSVEQFIVIGDRKTPGETASYCLRMEKEYNVRCLYLPPDEQERYLKRWPEFAAFLPWNSITRRNIGFIVAYEGNADIVVTIDDDNFIRDKDYLGRHSHVGDAAGMQAVSSRTGWWNVCDMLEESHHTRFYHRGYPFSKRTGDQEKDLIMKEIHGRVAVNAGLWLEEPDVDAIARQDSSLFVTGPAASFKERIACDVGTWSPFDSQNTALARDVIPSYCMLPHIGRYDDIWGSYIVRHICDHLGDLVTYGSPLVRQRRNPQSIIKNIEDEKLGMEYTDIFLDGLRSCKLSASDYRGSFSEIARQFPASISKVCESHNKQPRVFDNVCEGLRLWAGVFKDL